MGQQGHYEVARSFCTHSMQILHYTARTGGSDMDKREHANHIEIKCLHTHPHTTTRH